MAPPFPPRPCIFTRMLPGDIAMHFLVWRKSMLFSYCHQRHSQFNPMYQEHSQKFLHQSGLLQKQEGLDYSLSEASISCPGIKLPWSKEAKEAPKELLWKLGETWERKTVLRIISKCLNTFPATLNYFFVVGTMSFLISFSVTWQTALNARTDLECMSRA